MRKRLGKVNSRAAGAFRPACVLSASTNSARIGSTSSRRCLELTARTVTVAPSKSKQSRVNVKSSFIRKPVSTATRYSNARSAPAMPYNSAPPVAAASSARTSSGVNARRWWRLSVRSFNFGT